MEKIKNFITVEDFEKEEIFKKAKETLDARDALGVTTNVLLGVGAAAVAAGVVMLVIAHSDEKAGDETVALFPIAGPRGGGVAVEWRF